jgi:hypothetical protein
VRARRLLAALPLLALLSSLAPAQAAAEPAAVSYDHVRGGNVLPPGSTGHVPSTELAAALRGQYRPENSRDQRDLYVDWGLKDWTLAGADPAARTGKDTLQQAYAPAGRGDVSIRRDGWGVPRIAGETDEAAQFGVGYAMAEDRLFQADVFRHVARGEMAQFLGGQQWYDYDRTWRQEFYTDDELLDMLDRFYDEREQGLLQSYLDGINAYIDEALADPRKLPAEYAALQIAPEKWELRHSLAIFVLQSRDSVEGFGKELYNATFLAELEKRHGRAAAERVFRDVRFYRDPGAYTTAPAAENAFPYPGGGFEGRDAPGVVLPDDDGAAAQLLAREAAVVTALEKVGLARRQASNALTVHGNRTSDGRPILLGGPQLAYLAPGIFWEFEISSPNQQARGAGFVGTAGAVLNGKSPTHAWSITYGYTDQVDTFLVPLDPARPATHYLRYGQSKPLQSYTSTVRCRTYAVGLTGSSPGDSTCDDLPLAQTDLEVRRVPEYGPVIGEVNVDGEPHVVVKARAHWMQEVANGKPFFAFSRATTMDQFRAAHRDFTISLNVNYASTTAATPASGTWRSRRCARRAQTSGSPPSATDASTGRASCRWTTSRMPSTPSRASQRTGTTRSARAGTTVTRTSGVTSSGSTCCRDASSRWPGAAGSRRRTSGRSTAKRPSRTGGGTTSHRCSSVRSRTASISAPPRSIPPLWRRCRRCRRGTGSARPRRGRTARGGTTTPRPRSSTHGCSSCSGACSPTTSATPTTTAGSGWARPSPPATTTCTRRCCSRSCSGSRRRSRPSTTGSTVPTGTSWSGSRSPRPSPTSMSASTAGRLPGAGRPCSRPTSRSGCWQWLRIPS